jgi:uncharacterized membrane protein
MDMSRSGKAAVYATATVTTIGVNHSIVVPKISRLRGQLSGFSTERLMHFLTLLGRDVEITIKPAPRSRRQGHLRVVATV